MSTLLSKNNLNDWGVKNVKGNNKMVIGLLLVFIISFLIGFTNAIKKRDRIKQEKVTVVTQHTFKTTDD